MRVAHSTVRVHYSSKPQFQLSVGIVGLIYFTIPVTYGVTNIFIGLLTDRLVRLHTHNLEDMIVYQYVLHGVDFAITQTR